jgi:pseudouridine synthase
MLNKPRGWVTTVSDPHHFQTVTRLLKLQERVYPVGRLDQSSEGLLILTNDGELTYRLTHPRFGVIRRYELVVKGRLTSEELRALAAGVELEDGRTRPIRTKVLEEANTTRIEVEIGEGKKRQLRRMFEHLGHPVISLKRTRFATLKLGRLKPGAYRALTPKEVKSLYRVVGLEED